MHWASPAPAWPGDNGHGTTSYIPYLQSWLANSLHGDGIDGLGWHHSFIAAVIRDPAEIGLLPDGAISRN